MREKRPFIITLFGDLYFMAALLSIISLVFPSFFNQIGFTYSPVIPIFNNTIIKIGLPIILLILSLGLFKLKMWAYWIIVIFDILYLIVCIFGYIQNMKLVSSQYFITTFIELIFILPSKVYFEEKTFISQCS